MGRDNETGYDRLKSHRGGGYSGMKVGGRHKWYYDRGEWREQKVTPDEWNIYYQTTKRRAGKAPEDSGAPVGTQYNWLIVSHQRVDKLDANSYMTCLEGKKFKVAHKRAAKQQWNLGEKGQRRKVIAYLEQVIRDLKAADDVEAVPYTVGEEERIYGLEHFTREELYELAAELGIPKRSTMKRDELLTAVKEARRAGAASEPGESEAATPALEGRQGQSADGDGEQQLREKSREDLYRMASRRGIRGRSGMRKRELVKALSRDSGARA